MKKSSKKSANKKVLVIATLILVSTVVGLGLYVFSHSTNTYTDTANAFRFVYPHSWQEVPYRWQGGNEVPEPDWAKKSRPVEIKPAVINSKDSNNVSVTACDVVGTSIAKAKESKDKFHTQQEGVINGANYLYDELNFKGDAESYKDHTYIYEKNDKCVYLAWRENWRHPMSGTDFDDSQNVEGFNLIADTLEIL